MDNTLTLHVLVDMYISICTYVVTDLELTVLPINLMWIILGPSCQ